MTKSEHTEQDPRMVKRLELLEERMRTQGRVIQECRLTQGRQAETLQDLQLKVDRDFDVIEWVQNALASQEKEVLARLTELVEENQQLRRELEKEKDVERVTALKELTNTDVRLRWINAFGIVLSIIAAITAIVLAFFWR